MEQINEQFQLDGDDLNNNDDEKSTGLEEESKKSGSEPVSGTDSNYQTDEE